MLHRIAIHSSRSSGSSLAKYSKRASLQRLVGSSRGFADDKENDDRKEREGGFRNTIVKIVEGRSSTRNLVIGGAAVTSLGVAYILFDLTHAFLSLTPASSMYYGFIGGAMTAGTTAGLAWYGERSFQISADRAVAKAMKVINQNETVVAYIGKSRPASIKSFSSKYGGFAVNATKARLSWESPQIQVQFVLEGSKMGDRSGGGGGQQAIASVVYGKKGFSEVLEYVGVDFSPQDPHSATLVVEGNASKFTIANALKAHCFNMSKTK